MIKSNIRSASARFHMHAHWPTISTSTSRGGLRSAEEHHHLHPSNSSTTIPSCSMARPATHLCRSAEYVSPLPPKRASPPKNTQYRRCSQPTPIEHTLQKSPTELHTCTSAHRLHNSRGQGTQGDEYLQQAANASLAPRVMALACVSTLIPEEQRPLSHLPPRYKICL